MSPPSWRARPLHWLLWWLTAPPPVFYGAAITLLVLCLQALFLGLVVGNHLAGR